ncbi:MAG: VOC family protein [Myxococcales bacterium]|nr:VOC family protein [Myxococcales bacterium]
MAYTTNRFCWTGIVSTDPDKVVGFYPEVLGWSASTVEMDGSSMPIFAKGEQTLCHVRGPMMDGEPSHWNSYLRVDDVDASTAAAKEHGGNVVVEPTDIAPGRFSVVTTPSGAHLHLFKEADPAAQHIADGPGAVGWVELWSKDIDADLSWLKAAFGYEVEQMQMPDGPYYILKHGGEQRGGAMASTNEKAPAMFLSWVSVADVDETVGRATSHGGAVIAPAFDVPNVGRLAILADSTGGVFGVMTPPAS